MNIIFLLEYKIYIYIESEKQDFDIIFAILSCRK